MISPVLLIYRASRLLSSSNVQIPKHHIWIFNRPFVTSQLLYRGRGVPLHIKKLFKKENNLENEVRFCMNKCEVSIVRFLLNHTRFVLKLV